MGGYGRAGGRHHVSQYGTNDLTASWNFVRNTAMDAGLFPAGMRWPSSKNSLHKSVGDLAAR